MGAARSIGNPYTPVLIEGNATDFILYWPTSVRLFRYALLRSLSSLCEPPCHTGPTVWITYFALRLPPVVITASPVGSSPRCSRILLHSSSIFGPPARWIAPSTPPPPIRLELAAFTIASVSSSVI